MIEASLGYIGLCLKTHKETGVEVNTCNSSIWEPEAEESRVQSQAQQYSKFQVSLGFVIPCPKTK